MPYQGLQRARVEEVKVRDSSADAALRASTYVIFGLSAALVVCGACLAYLFAQNRSLKSDTALRQRGIKPSGNRTVMAVQVKEGGPLMTLGDAEMASKV